MTELDEGLTEYKKLISLNLCGNFLSDINPDFIPTTVKSLELQTNCISDVSGFAESLPVELLYLGLSKNFFTSGNTMLFIILNFVIFRNKCYNKILSWFPETIEGIGLLPFKLTVLDLSDNDIYHLEPVLDAVSRLPNLNGLQLSGNPCSVRYINND